MHAARYRLQQSSRLVTHDIMSPADSLRRRCSEVNSHLQDVLPFFWYFLSLLSLSLSFYHREAREMKAV